MNLVTTTLSIYNIFCYRFEWEKLGGAIISLCNSLYLYELYLPKDDLVSM